MKILLDTHMLDQRQTGIERYWKNLADNLNKNNQLDISLYSNLPKKKLRGFDLNSFQICTPPLANGFFRILFGFNKAIIKEKPDVIHASNFTPYVKTCPSVVTVHDLCFKTYPETFKKKSLLAFDLFFKHSLDLADAIIAVSISVKNNLINYYNVDASKIFVIYEAPDPDFQYIHDKNKIKKIIFVKFKTNKDYFLVVGDVDKRKNPLGIINAFQNFFKNKEIELVFVGPNKMKDTIQSKYQSAIAQGEIRFLDYVADQDLNYLYNGATALIFNSLCEGFGLPIVEAMSCKTPVICSDIPVFREIASNAAIFVKNEIELYRGMEQMITNDPLRNKYAQLGFQRSKLFSWDKTAKETTRIYELVFQRNLH